MPGFDPIVGKALIPLPLRLKSQVYSARHFVLGVHEMSDAGEAYTHQSRQT